MFLAAVGITAAPVNADEAPTKLDVRITQLSPAVLKPGAAVTLNGTITNDSDRKWTSVQAYLVAPRSPFTSRKQVTDAVASGVSYTGDRRVALKSIDELGTLDPGSTVSFKIRVPYSVLQVGAEGVYPVGVQVLGTGEDGIRSNKSIGRATTFLPMVKSQKSTPASVVVPFVTPDRRGAKGYVNPKGLAASAAPGGQLRNLIDLTYKIPNSVLSLIIDPALLAELDDIAKAKRLPRDVSISKTQRRAAGELRDDLLTRARQSNYWILGYARPDVLAIERSGTAAIDRAVDRATRSTMQRFDLTGQRVIWPTRDGVTQALGDKQHGDANTPMIVSRGALPRWEPERGSIVNQSTRNGPMPVLVNSPLDSGVPGYPTPTTFRQRILSETALAAMERNLDPEARSNVVALVDPAWNPGSNLESSKLNEAFENDLIDGTALDVILRAKRSELRGRLPKSSGAKSISPAQIQSVDAALDITTALAAIVVDAKQLRAEQATRAADLVSLQWRRDSAGGTEAARRFSRATEQEFESITVEGPPAVTLSGTEGSFPITITNGTSRTTRIGLRLTSTNPRLDVRAVDPVEVAAGERRTLTVNADVGNQGSSTFTTSMTTSDGTAFGEPAVFNVRTSRVGAAVWVAIAIAALVAAFALTRRFFTRRGRGNSGIGSPELDGSELDRPESSATEPTAPKAESDSGRNEYLPTDD